MKIFNCLKEYLCGRPEVILDFIFEDGLLYIAIKNIGRKPAYKISINFEQRFRGVEGGKIISELPLFKLIEFMPPGKEIKTFLDSSSAYFAREEPEQISAEVNYQNIKSAKYRTTIVHNLGIYKEIGYVTRNANQQKV
ncbi:MAG: hypothetical protein HND52_02630 [Ignavibacteriae bacterium]|nr:hypothetical protein [Ignavibacteriota bacterium]NOG96846.1 hypothetical protein [Ignavibacteriota bacterium]